MPWARRLWALRLPHCLTSMVSALLDPLSPSESIGSRLRLIRAAPQLEITMEFAGLFLAVTIVMLVAWWGSRAPALALYAATLAAALAIYLHHASDVLRLSF